jgi:hypothetical protein
MLDNEQMEQLKEFFGPSIDFSKVKIKASPFCSGNRPWACGNVVRVPRAKPGQTFAVDMADLVHECGHVWQHQSGQLVFLSALGEQIKASIIHKFDPYNFGGPAGVAALRKLTAFLTEGQAQIITEYWKSQHGFTHDRLQTPFSPDYVQGLFQLIQHERIGVAAPGQATFASRVDSVATQLVNWVLGLFE